MKHAPNLIIFTLEELNYKCIIVYNLYINRVWSQQKFLNTLANFAHHLTHKSLKKIKLQIVAKLSMRCKANSNIMQL